MSTAAATADAVPAPRKGKKILIVSTDPASNLDEMLKVELSDTPRLIPGATGFFAMNIDPEAAADAYRGRVIDQMGVAANEAERATVRE